MSQHIYKSDKHTVTVGVDCPLRYVFGFVDPAGEETIFLGEPIENYPPTEEGVDLVLQDAARYLRAPDSVRAALLEDLRKLAAGESINYVKHH